MFETQLLQGKTRIEIPLATRLNRTVVNEVSPQPDAARIWKESLIVKDYGSGWLPRRNPYGWCNCAGQVWAERRTTVLDDVEWNKFKDDDGYRVLGFGESPKSGDLAIYSEIDIGYLHVGRVHEMRMRMGHSVAAPWILSKWDSASGEYFHWPEEVPFRKQFPQYTLVYWTDRGGTE